MCMYQMYFFSISKQKKTSRLSESSHMCNSLLTIDHLVLKKQGSAGIRTQDLLHPGIKPLDHWATYMHIFTKNTNSFFICNFLLGEGSPIKGRQAWLILDFFA